MREWLRALLAWPTFQYWVGLVSGTTFVICLMAAMVLHLSMSTTYVADEEVIGPLFILALLAALSFWVSSKMSGEKSILGLSQWRQYYRPLCDDARLGKEIAVLKAEQERLEKQLKHSALLPEYRACHQKRLSVIADELLRLSKEREPLTERLKYFESLQEKAKINATAKQLVGRGSSVPITSEPPTEDAQALPRPGEAPAVKKSSLPRPTETAKTEEELRQELGN